MYRYIGPRFKKIKKLGNLIGFTKKKILKKNIKNIYFNTYKQKLKIYYGINEKQFYWKYIYISNNLNINKYLFIFKLLEMRLDNIIFKLGIISTIPASRQIINHNHIMINNFLINLPNFFCKLNDIIIIKNIYKYNNIIKNLIKIKKYYKIPKYLIYYPLKKYKIIIKKIINIKYIFFSIILIKEIISKYFKKNIY
uniref:Ribosomal protein S4 n=1 Tax=Balanophora laxiflora TaxID=1128103 RepID=A0A3S5XHK1_9MAGN